MRTNSPDQAKASRVNGARSNGPRSAAGKGKSAQNSIQKGLFSRQVVIQQLGEKESDYDEAKKRFWQVLQPSSTLEEMLVTDFVENWWRRERVRRAESEELRSRLAALRLRQIIAQEARVEALKEEFLVLVDKYRTAEDEEKRYDFIEELEGVRQELSLSSVGLNFLLGIMNRLKEAVIRGDILSVTEETKLTATVGFTNESAQMSRQLNALLRDRKQQQTQGPASPSEPLSEREKEVLGIAERMREFAAKQEAEKSKSDSGEERDQAIPAGGQAEQWREPRSQEPSAKKSSKGKTESSPEELRIVLLLLIERCSLILDFKKQRLEMLEETESKSSSSLALLDITSERFSRAETAG